MIFYYICPVRFVTLVLLSQRSYTTPCFVLDRIVQILRAFRTEKARESVCQLLELPPIGSLAMVSGAFEFEIQKMNGELRNTYGRLVLLGTMDRGSEIYSTHTSVHLMWAVNLCLDHIPSPR